MTSSIQFIHAMRLVNIHKIKPAGPGLTGEARKGTLTVATLF